MKSIKLNVFFNMVQTIMRIIFPLITFPYVARVLGVVELGKFNYSNSIASYYTLLAGMGIATYAVREGAAKRDSKADIEEFSKNIFSINVYSTIFASIVLGGCLLCIRQFDNYRMIIIILSFQGVFETLGRNWIYIIYEDYLYITIRSIFFQLISLILLFLYVKDANDILAYTAITSLSIIGGHAVNIFTSQKYCKIKFTFFPDKKMIIPIILMFSTSISIVIYGNSDLTILGIFGEDRDVGLYSVSVKIYKVMKQLVAAIVTVTIPRFSYFSGKNRKKDFQNLFDRVLNILILILLPVSTGLFMMSEECIVILSGRDYLEASMSIKILSVTMIFNLFAYIFGYCVVIPNRREKVFFIATFVSACVNIVLNLMFIPVFKQNAAAATTLVSECIAAIICCIEANKYVDIQVDKKNLFSVIIGCFCIVGVCGFTRYLVSNLMMRFFLSVAVSVILFIIVQVFLKNRILKEITALR